VSPLLELYASADRSTRVRGRRWYPLTRRRLQELAVKHGRPLSQVVAVFAIMSPASQLITCLRWTEEVLEGERLGGRYPNVQAPFVLGALQAHHPSRYVRGPKTGAFYRALMGDPNVVVIDRWAARAAGWDESGHSIPVRRRKEMEEAYRAAAAEVGERVRNFQAITWLALRESTAKQVHGKAVVPKLWDVTHKSISDSEMGKETES
jgi:hypothetical protein